MRQYLVFAPPSGPCGRDGPEVSVVSSPLGRRRPGGPTAMNQVTRKFPLRKHDFLDEFLVTLWWSTWNGYNAQWGFMNLSDMPITGTLTVYDSNNSVVVAVQLSIVAGGRAF